MLEADAFQIPHQMQILFVIVMACGGVGNMLALWNKFGAAMLHQLHPAEKTQDICLQLIQRHLASLGLTLE